MIRQHQPLTDNDAGGKRGGNELRDRSAPAGRRSPGRPLKKFGCTSASPFPLSATRAMLTTDFSLRAMAATSDVFQRDRGGQTRRLVSPHVYCAGQRTAIATDQHQRTATTACPRQALDSYRAPTKPVTMPLMPLPDPLSQFTAERSPRRTLAGAEAARCLAACPRVYSRAVAICFAARFRSR